MSGWEESELWVGFDSVCVYQCGSCRDYSDPDHWSFEWVHFRSCGHATEDDAKQAAEEYLIELAQTMARLVSEAREDRIATKAGKRE